MKSSKKLNNKNQLESYLGANLLNIIDDSIIVTNLDGIIIYWNKGAELIFGYTAQEAIGKTPEIIYPNRSEEMLRKDLKRMIDGHDYIGEWEGTRKDGEKVWVNIKMTTIRDEKSEVVGFIGISKDITEQKLMVKELIQSETKYQTIFENSGEGIFLFRNKFIDVNKKVCELFGYKKSEIIGKSPMDFSPERQSDGSLSKEKASFYIKSAIDNGHISFYWQHLNRDKKIIEARITINRVRIQGESFLIAIMQDMTDFLNNQRKLKEKTEELTEQNKKILELNDELNETNARLKIINKQIQANERKFRVAFKTSPDAVNINRMSDGLYIDINEGFTMLTGYTEDDVKGKTSSEINIWVDSKDRTELVKQLMKNEEVSNLEAEFRKKDGSITTALMSASIIEINGEKHILSITRDISERKRQEEKLHEAMKKAEESDMLKSAFLANMSHEIRTPLNAILGFSQLIKEKVIEPDKLEKYIDIIITRSKNLLQIINDIIDISKIEANQLNIEIREFSLNKLLYELFTQFEAELTTQDRKSVKLYFTADLNKSASYIKTDEFRLKQILTNLISNAIKFTDKGKIEFGYKVKDDQLEFYVSDTGVGIPAVAMQQIFERFRQADNSSTREFGGTGLGLSISKQLVEMLGGEIWVESELNQGAQFYFTIPFRPINENSKKQDTDTTGAFSLINKKILIVEDDQISMTYLEELLLPTQAKIAKAYDGVQALERFENEKLDLILLDINLPRMNGNEVIREIRKLNNNIPIIAQSAYAMANDKTECFSAGCNEYVTKPIDSKLLFSIIKNYLH